jgi:tripartite-type tricarboxylate transporter receptor subunit TctC
MKVLAQPDVRRQFATLGIDVIGGTPAEFAAVIPNETRQWAKLIKAMGIQPIE